MFPNKNSLNTCIGLWKGNILSILLECLLSIKSCCTEDYVFQSFGEAVAVLMFFPACKVSLSVYSLCRCRNSFHESLKQIGSAQHQGNAVGMGSYETIQHFNDIKEHLHTVKRDVEHLVQRNVQVLIRDWDLILSSLKTRFSCLNSLFWPFSCTESCWEGYEVPRGASHAFLLIHCSFCDLHRHPISPVLLLRHVQVRRRRF